MSCGGSCGRDLTKKLTAEQYHVTQEAGTEEVKKLFQSFLFQFDLHGCLLKPFTGKFNDHHEVGTYICIVCSNPLFRYGRFLAFGLVFEVLPLHLSW